MIPESSVSSGELHVRVMTTKQVAGPCCPSLWLCHRCSLRPLIARGSTWRGFSRTVLTAQRGAGVRAELAAWSSSCLPTFPVSLEVLAFSLVLQGQPLRHRGRQSPGVTDGRAAQHRVNGKWLTFGQVTSLSSRPAVMRLGSISPAPESLHVLLLWYRHL